LKGEKKNCGERARSRAYAEYKTLEIKLVIQVAMI